MLPHISWKRRSRSTHLTKQYIQKILADQDLNAFLNQEIYPVIANSVTSYKVRVQSNLVNLSIFSLAMKVEQSMWDWQLNLSLHYTVFRQIYSNVLTLEALKIFSAYKNECGDFWPFICKTVYVRFLSKYFECCIETSQLIIVAASFCKVKNSQVKK